MAVRVVGTPGRGGLHRAARDGDVRSLSEPDRPRGRPGPGRPDGHRHTGAGNGSAAPPPPTAAPRPPHPAPATAAPQPPTPRGHAGGPAAAVRPATERWGAHISGPGLPLHVDDLLRYAVSIGASDLHLTVNMPPTVRLHGALRPMEDVGRIDNNQLRDMIFGILPQTHRERFEAEHELDTSHSIAGRRPVPGERLPAAGDHRRGPAAHPSRDPRVQHASACPNRSGASPSCGAAWCWSPARPDRASRPPWPRSSTSSTGPSRCTS